MGVFVDYLSSPFADVSETPTTILEASAHSLLVNGLIVCNTGAQDIVFGLRKLRTQALPIEISYVNRFTIKAYETVDIISRIGLQVILEYSTAETPNIVDSLICFSDGYSQIFDCEISYTKLNETPITI